MYFQELTSAGTFLIKRGKGFFKSITINAPGSLTFQIFDNTVASGTAIAGGAAPFAAPTTPLTLYLWSWLLEWLNYRGRRQRVSHGRILLKKEKHMPKNSGNSYTPDRDNTAGCNAEQDLSSLDARYNNHADRQGVNASRHDFHNGERVETGANPRNADEKPRDSFAKPLNTETASEYSEQCRQDRVERQDLLKHAAREDGQGPLAIPPFDPRGWFMRIGVPINRQPSDVESQGSGFFESAEHQQRQRELEQAELRRKTEWELLDADVSFHEYKVRRSCQLLTEPDLPLDEMSFSDYKVARSLERRKDTTPNQLTYDENADPDDTSGPAIVYPERRR
jgi:hypothetical protein